MSLKDDLRVVIERLGARPPERPIDEELEERVHGRVYALGLPSVEAYLARVGRSIDDEVPYLAGPFTNGWTWFFRDAEPLQVIATRFASQPRTGPVRIWVAGCSTGEEAFGTAMLFTDHGVDVRVLGTDVDAVRIAEARVAEYGEASMRRVSPEARARHFEDLPDGRARVRASIHSRVELRVHNLLDAPVAPPDGGWDLIVCRNVLLHLSPNAAHAVQRRLEAEAPRVLLFGPADVVPRTRTVFRRPSFPTLVPPVLPSQPPPVAAKEPWSHATELVARSAFEDARNVLVALLDASPEHVPARLTLGNLYVERHAFDDAEQAYRAVEDVDPCCAELHFVWGTLHRKRGDWGAAASSLRRALFHDPGLWPARFLLAGVWDRTGEPERARRALADTLESLDARPTIQWRSHVDDFASLACPPAAVRAACLRRLGREREITSEVLAEGSAGGALETRANHPVSR